MIQNMKIEQLKEVMELVNRVFDEFEAPGYTEEGIRNFYKFANYNNIKIQLERNFKILVYEQNRKIVGMIGYRDYSHICLLFVEKEYHKQGIGKKLVEKTKEICQSKVSNLQEITVNSSPYGIDFYHKMGFVNTEKEQIVDGIRYTPMKLFLKEK